MISKAETGKNPSTARNVDSFNVFFEFFNQTDLRKQDPFLSSQSHPLHSNPLHSPFSYEIKCSTQHIKVNNKFHRGGGGGGWYYTAGGKVSFCWPRHVKFYFRRNWVNQSKWASSLWSSVYMTCFSQSTKHFCFIQWTLQEYLTARWFVKRKEIPCRGNSSKMVMKFIHSSFYSTMSRWISRQMVIFKAVQFPEELHFFLWAMLTISP